MATTGGEAGTTGMPPCISSKDIRGSSVSQACVGLIRSMNMASDKKEPLQVGSGMVIKKQNQCITIHINKHLQGCIGCFPLIKKVILDHLCILSLKREVREGRCIVFLQLYMISKRMLMLLSTAPSILLAEFQEQEEAYPAENYKEGKDDGYPDQLRRYPLLFLAITDDGVLSSILAVDHDRRAYLFVLSLPSCSILLPIRWFIDDDYHLGEGLFHGDCSLSLIERNWRERGLFGTCGGNDYYDDNNKNERLFDSLAVWLHDGH